MSHTLKIKKVEEEKFCVVDNEGNAICDLKADEVHPHYHSMEVDEEQDWNPGEVHPNTEVEGKAKADTEDPTEEGKGIKRIVKAAFSDMKQGKIPKDAIGVCLTSDEDGVSVHVRFSRKSDDKDRQKPWFGFKFTPVNGQMRVSRHVMVRDDRIKTEENHVIAVEGTAY